jgi:PPOX class probable F420-dependent enzyme
MGIALSDDAKGLLDRPNFAHLATLMSDGSPHSAPVWVGRENDLLVVCTDADSLKGKNTQRDPRVSISMVDFDDPYAELQLRGSVVEWRPDPELKYYDAMSQKIYRQTLALPRRAIANRSDHRGHESALLKAALRTHPTQDDLGEMLNPCYPWEPSPSRRPSWLRHRSEVQF